MTCGLVLITFSFPSPTFTSPDGLFLFFRFFTFALPPTTFAAFFP
jgi:hypothetical protein